MEIEYNMDLDAIAVKYKEKVGLATAPAPGVAKRPTKRAAGAGSAGGDASKAAGEAGLDDFEAEEDEEEAVAQMSEHQRKRYRIAQEAASQTRQIREATLKLATQGSGDPEADAAAAQHRAAVLARMPDAAMLEKRKAVDEATAEVLQGMVKRQKEVDVERQRLAKFTVRLAARMLTFRAQASS